VLWTNLKVYRTAAKAKILRWVFGSIDPYLPLPQNVSLSPSLEVAAAYLSVERRLNFQISTKEPKEWQVLARKKLIELAGYQIIRPKPKVTRTLDETVIGKNLFKRSTYLRTNLCTDIPVHLIYEKPIHKPCPVFVHLAGSTSGVHIGWGGIKVPIDHQRVAIGGDLARQAARRGYLAVAIEQSGYGERAERLLWKRSKNRTIDNANHLLLLGRSLVGVGASDISAVLDWLLGTNSCFAIDPDRLFLFGHSAGGTLAQYATAFDTRIKGVLASGSVGPIIETLGSRGQDSGEGIVPGFLEWFDSADLIALIGPRPFVGLSGHADHIFPFSGVSKVIKEAEKFYISLGAREAIQAVEANGKHQYYSNKTWEAWEKWIDPKMKKNSF